MAVGSRRGGASVTSSGEAFGIDQLGSGHDFSETPYLEFMRTASLSVGVYRLAAVASDPQQPHAEDEVYHVLEGEARLRVDGEDLTVRAGTVAFVGAGVEHYFHSIEKDLEVLVFFAPAEYSLTSGVAVQPSELQEGACE